MSAYDGTLTGTTAFVTGKFGQALSLNGASDSGVTLPALPALLNVAGGGTVGAIDATSWAVEFWINTTLAASASGPGLFIIFNSPFYVQLSLVNGSIAIQASYGSDQNGSSFWNGNGSTASSHVGSKLVNDGAPHHVAFSYQNGNCWLFIDGVLQLSNSDGSKVLNPGNGSAITLCASTFSSFTGWIDQLVVWPDAQYQAAFTPDASPFAGNEGMQALYALDGTAANTATATLTLLPTNAGLFFHPAAWDVNSTRALTIYTGNPMKTIVQTTSIALTINTNSLQAPYPRLLVEVDGQPQSITLNPSTSSYPVATGLLAGKHSLTVSLDALTASQNKWNGMAAALQLTGVVIDSGGSAELPNIPDADVWFAGDSITAGQWVFGDTTTVPSGNDVTLASAQQTWSYNAGVALGGTAAILGIPGGALAAPNTSGNGGCPPFGGTGGYFSTFANGIARNLTTRVPKAIFINLGTNDTLLNLSAAAFQAAVTSTSQEIASALPGTLIVWLVPFGGYYQAAIEAGVAAVGNSLVSVMQTAGFEDAGGLASLVHPLAYNSRYLIAPKVIDAALPLLHPQSQGSKSQGFSYTFS